MVYYHNYVRLEENGENGVNFGLKEQKSALKLRVSPSILNDLTFLLLDQLSDQGKISGFSDVSAKSLVTRNSKFDGNTLNLQSAVLFLLHCILVIFLATNRKNKVQRANSYKNGTFSTFDGFFVA